ncbi:MAG: MMPL family transporter, partial [Treponema sp.]|nr:MMPL family transporter [Treponema sp.]
FSVLGVSRIIIDNVFVEYFKASTDISKSDRFIREKFGGSKIVSVVVEAENTETLLMPDVLIAMDSLGTYLEDYVSEVGKVLGFTDLVKRINQVFNADESPNGIKSGNNVFNDNFGFEDFGFEVPTESGFNDFGFGEFDIQDSEPPAFDNSKDVQAGNEITLLDSDQLMQLLHEAASRGMNRGMDSDELIREMEKLLNFEGAAYYEIPSSPERYGKTRPEELQQLVANYLILLSGNISSYANDPLEPTAIKSTIQLKTLGNEDTGRVIGKIQQFIEDRFPDSITTLIGGSALVEDSLNHLVVESQIISVIISILIVFFIITISYRSFTAGAIGIAPLSICLLINFAVMGFAGIKLNIGTSMVASVSVGIGIDYTIHYIEAYKREYLSAKGKGGFIFNTFASSGKAILINAISVGAGFAVLHFSQFIMLKHLGLLIALTMCSSAIVSLTVIPVLLSLIDPKFIRRVL